MKTIVCFPVHKIINTFYWPIQTGKDRCKWHTAMQNASNFSCQAATNFCSGLIANLRYSVTPHLGQFMTLWPMSHISLTAFHSVTMKDVMYPLGGVVSFSCDCNLAMNVITEARGNNNLPIVSNNRSWTPFDYQRLTETDIKPYLCITWDIIIHPCLCFG